MSGKPTQIELYISAQNLPNKDTLSKSDPFAVVEFKSGKEEFKEIGRTEVAKNNLNPVFKKRFVVEYQFEVQQTVRVRFFDSDDIKHDSDLSKQEYLGSIEFSCAELVTSKGLTISKELINAKGNPAKKMLESL
jgi:Ca2+-dependent lipid-binding protein